MRMRGSAALGLATVGLLATCPGAHAASCLPPDGARVLARTAAVTVSAVPGRVTACDRATGRRAVFRGLDATMATVRGTTAAVTGRRCEADGRCRPAVVQLYPPRGTVHLAPKVDGCGGSPRDRACGLPRKLVLGRYRGTAWEVGGEIVRWCPGGPPGQVSSSGTTPGSLRASATGRAFGWSSADGEGGTRRLRMRFGCGPDRPIACRRVGRDRVLIDRDGLVVFRRGNRLQTCHRSNGRRRVIAGSAFDDGTISEGTIMASAGPYVAYIRVLEEASGVGYVDSIVLDARTGVPDFLFFTGTPYGSGTVARHVVLRPDGRVIASTRTLDGGGAIVRCRFGSCEAAAKAPPLAYSPALDASSLRDLGDRVCWREGDVERCTPLGR